VELTFALVLTAAAAGLVLALGLAVRRRMFALASALGATRRQLAGFVAGEAGITVAGGVLLGSVMGWGLSHMLVTVLTGVFDPPPSQLAVPWSYLGTLVAVAVGAIGLAAAGVIRSAARPSIAALREG
jgi:putative ABC transport system permease protein